MPRYFSDEQIAELAVSYEDISRKFRELQERICAQKFETSRGAEFAKHGLLRRLDTLVRAIDQVPTAHIPNIRPDEISIN